MAIKQKQKRKASPTALAAMRGLVPMPDRSGYSVDLGQVKPTHQSFSASGFWLLDVEGEIFATFGWKPRSFEKPEDDRFNLAVAFSITRKTLKSFVDSCWTELALRKDKTFAESMEDALSPQDKQWAESYTCKSSLPQRPGSEMREFAASMIVATLWNERGYLEFLEISSEVVRASLDGHPRDADPVHSLAIVVMSPKLLYGFLIESKKLLVDASIRETDNGIAIRQ